AKTAQGSLRSELLGPMIEGRTSLALAWSEEAARYDATRVATTAERTDGGHALRGTKTWVLNGHAAEQLVVSAKTKAGVSLFAVPRAASGVHVESVKTMDGGRAARVRLDGAVGQLLGDDGAGAGVLDEVLDMGAAAACAEGLGIANAVLWMTVEYLRTRKQFGVPIGVFQALQHRAVDMFVAVELMKGTSILANARVASDDPELRRSAVSAAKATLSTSGFMVVAQAIQLHGGIGVTDEHDVSLYFKRMRVLNALFGDEEHHVQRYMSSPRFTEALG
ncbi:MAG: acyl-CoA dehydrogenase family protein, partial [Sandaracinaceae bacterium]